MWSIVRKADEASLERARRMVDEFERCHLKTEAPRSSRYVDDGGLVFTRDLSRHATTPYLHEEWKYTYGIGSNFHYDVRSDRASSTAELQDIDGEWHRIGDHLNVDAFGRVR